MFQRVVERFPTCQQQIERLSREDADFREMCQDYDLAAQTLARWSRSLPKTEARIQEYQLLLQELEAEIYEALADAKQTGYGIAGSE
jgi:hypothetical protein